MNNLVPLLLDGTARQHTGVDGFYKGSLDCGNVDLAFAHSDYVIGRFGRADLDREEEGPFAGGRHAQVGGAGAYVILHLGSDHEGRLARVVPVRAGTRLITVLPPDRS